MPIPKWLADDLTLPLIAAPMFLVSGVDLTQAACAQGIVGTFPALNARTSEDLDQWLSSLVGFVQARRAAKEKCSPFGVNLIVHRSNPRLEADLALLEKHRVSLVITSLGAVSELVSRVHAWGGLVFHDVTTARHARKAAEAGVDGLIAVANGAGGHAGKVNPFALVGELRRFWKGTLILAGCLGSGSDILAAQIMGADLAYMGTRFIATRQSQAVDAYKDMIVQSQVEDILYTPAVSGVPANFMRASLQAAGYEMEKLDRPGEVNYGQKLKPIQDEAKAWKTVWSAGQGVGTIQDIPSVEQLCTRLTQEYRSAIQTVADLKAIHERTA